jgi:2-polyprenyl-3-methyl-5-hydroxy-6-metoxy-1,4-benzoquinol methylase
MNQLSETIRYYDEHAEEFVRGTVSVDMEPLHGLFLAMLPETGTILDAGCGSGRDSKIFLDRGYSVTAIDASEKMVEATANLTGLVARRLQFQQMEFDNEFDGIWACASLLHVPRAEIDTVLNAFARALRPNGVCYLSFKEGQDDRMQDGRLFTDFTESGLKAVLAHCSELEVVRIWTTQDARPDRADQWVNALVRKRDKD